jgi:sigma-B regulation protein RsbU (phosphoserine phosphatase)
MARFAIWLGAYGAALWLVDRFTAGAPGLLWFIFWIALLPVALSYLYRLAKYVKYHLLWRLWRRLVVTYVFIAVVPVIFILFLVGLGVFIFSGQLAAYLVVIRFRHHYERLHEFNRVVAYEAEQTPPMPTRALLGHLQKIYLAGFADRMSGYSDVRVTMRLNSLVSGFDAHGGTVREPVDIPAWLTQDQFAGAVVDKGELAIRVMDRCATPSGKLTLIVSQPITAELLDRLGDGIGPVGVVITQPARQAVRPDAASVRVATPEGEYVTERTIASKSVQVPPPLSRGDLRVVGASTLEPVLWEGAKEQRLLAPVLIHATSRVGTLMQRLMATLGQFSQVYVWLFLAIAIFLLVIELVALVIGVRLTRSMTKTVDRLYEGTEHIKAGDFSYRTQLPARDQLTALGEAFDSTTASVERLLGELQEKSRLESELEIAREVQRQLFPRQVPRLPGLDLFGVCRAARSVSGDYYDFVPLDEDRVGIVLGDVSGKGISAALLMATIQSALHAQFYEGSSSCGTAEARPLSTAEVVGRLNLQIYQNSPAEKYATLFFSVYDARTRQLTYTNAGHLPPVLFRGGDTERLRTGGTVVGLFPNSKYEQAELELMPGDLLLAFTDGLTEPENAFDEEYGEERLLEVVRRARGSPPEVLVEEIYRSVSDWTGSPELQDDMTLLLARASA